MHHINVGAVHGAHRSLCREDAGRLGTVDAGDLNPVTSPGHVNQIVEGDQGNGVRGLAIGDRV